MKARRDRPGKPGPVTVNLGPQLDEQLHRLLKSVPVDVILSRLNEILQDTHCSSQCRLYLAEGGLMIEWSAKARILYGEVFTDLMKLAKLVGGELYATPADQDVKEEAGNSYRVMEVTIRSGPVSVFPTESKPL